MAALEDSREIKHKDKEGFWVEGVVESKDGVIVLVGCDSSLIYVFAFSPNISDRSRKAISRPGYELREWQNVYSAMEKVAGTRNNQTVVELTDIRAQSRSIHFLSYCGEGDRQ